MQRARVWREHALQGQPKVRVAQEEAVPQDDVALNDEEAVGESIY